MQLGPKFSTAPIPFLIVTPKSKMCEQLMLVFNVMSAFCYASKIHSQTSGCRGVGSPEACGKPRPIPEIKISSKKDWRSHGLNYCIAHSNQQPTFLLKGSLHSFWASTERVQPTQSVAVYKVFTSSFCLAIENSLWSTKRKRRIPLI